MENQKEMGNCYLSAFELMMLNKNLTLVHGIVHFDGGIMEGVPMIHAWCELNDAIVLDYSNNREIIVSKDFYYKRGIISETVKYNHDEMMEQLYLHTNEDGQSMLGFWDKRFLETDRKSLEIARERGVNYVDIEEHERNRVS